MSTDHSNLQRPRCAMPGFVKQAVEERGLMVAYRARPAYQQNDYLGCIVRAKRPDTRKKRLDQKLDELQRGGVYMNMAWRG